MKYYYLLIGVIVFITIIVVAVFIRMNYSNDSMNMQNYVMSKTEAEKQVSNKEIMVI